MKITTLILTALASLTIASQAGELYSLGNTGAVITARKADLIKILALATTGQKGASFDLREKAGIDLPQGTVVEVVSYFPGENPRLRGSYYPGQKPGSPSKIAKIVWDNGTHTGYVYDFELSRDRYVGSR